MAEAKAEAQESSSPRCLLLLAGGLPSSVSGTILLADACKPLSYGTRLRFTTRVVYSIVHYSGINTRCSTGKDTMYNLMHNLY